MPVRKLCYILASIVLCACTSKKELQIIPIEDGYAKRNGGIPVEGYYYLEGFKDTKYSIERVFQIIENNDFIFFKGNRVIRIVKNKRDVFFEDGTANIKKNKDNMYILLDTLNYYKSLIFSTEEMIYSFAFKKENKKQYDFHHVDRKSKIVFDYESVTIETLQHFLNIVAYERRQTKDQLGQYTYQLQHKETQAIDCEIIYYNDPEKGLDNVFKIRFP